MKNNLATWVIKGAFIALFAVFGLMSFQYPPKARIIPLIITFCGFLIAVVDCLFPQKIVKDTPRDVEREDKIEKLSPHDEAKAWGWLGFFFCLVVLGGLIYGSVLFLLFFLKWFWNEKWPVAIIVPAATGCCIYLLFHLAFRMELYSGIFFN